MRFTVPSSGTPVPHADEGCGRPRRDGARASDRGREVPGSRCALAAVVDRGRPPPRREVGGGRCRAGARRLRGRGTRRPPTTRRHRPCSELRARRARRGEPDPVAVRRWSCRSVGDVTSGCGGGTSSGAGIGRRAHGCARARRSSVRSTGSGARRTRSRRGRRTGVAVGERERSGPGCAPTPPTARDGPVRTARSGAPRDGRPRSAHRPHPGRARPVAPARWASPVERQLVRALRRVSLGYSPYRAA